MTGNFRKFIESSAKEDYQSKIIYGEAFIIHGLNYMIHDFSVERMLFRQGKKIKVLAARSAVPAQSAERTRLVHSLLERIQTEILYWAQLI